MKTGGLDFFFLLLPRFTYSHFCFPKDKGCLEFFILYVIKYGAWHRSYSLFFVCFILCGLPFSYVRTELFSITLPFFFSFPFLSFLSFSLSLRFLRLTFFKEAIRFVIFFVSFSVASTSTCQARMMPWGRSLVFLWPVTLRCAVGTQPLLFCFSLRFFFSHFRFLSVVFSFRQDQD